MESFVLSLFLLGTATPAPEMSLQSPSSEISCKSAVRLAMEYLQDAEEKGNAELFIKAAELFEFVVDKEPSHPDGDKLLWNAAVAYLGAKKEKQAMQMIERLLAAYPGTPLHDTASFKLAELHMQKFQMKKALEIFKSLCDDKKYKKSPFRVEALPFAARILEMDQQYEQAGAYWTRYAGATHDHDEKTAAISAALRCFEEAKAWNRLILEGKSFIKNLPLPDIALKISILWSIAGAHQKLGNESKYEKTLKAVVQTCQGVKSSAIVDEEVLNIWAEAIFTVAERERLSLDAKPLSVTSLKVAQKRIAELEKRREKIARLYFDVLDLNMPEWVVAAHYALGTLYEKEASLVSLVMTDIASKEQGPDLEAWMKGTQKRIEKLGEESRTCYLEALKSASKLGAYNVWSNRALEKLDFDVPADFPVFVKGKTISIQLNQ